MSAELWLGLQPAVAVLVVLGIIAVALYIIRALR